MCLGRSRRISNCFYPQIRHGSRGVAGLAYRAGYVEFEELVYDTVPSEASGATMYGMSSEDKIEAAKLAIRNLRQGSGTLQDFKQLMEHYGLTAKDIGETDESIEALEQTSETPPGIPPLPPGPSIVP